MVNAHCADALVCISNCDKITPGMLMAALRLNIPAIFVSGGPMEAGKVQAGRPRSLRRPGGRHDRRRRPAQVSDEEPAEMERSACPTCGSCSGMFTANSMNCLTEALGLALPGNGTIVATHADRKRLFLRSRPPHRGPGAPLLRAGRSRASCRASIASFEAFENAMTLDIAMGGSTNTVLHLLAAAHEGGGAFHHARHRPPLAPRARTSARSRRRRPPSTWRTSTAPAASSPSSPNSIAAACCIARRAHRALATLGDAIEQLGHAARSRKIRRQDFFRAAPGGIRTTEPFSQSARYPSARPRPRSRAPSATSSMPSAPMAASPSCTATSPKKAAS